MGYTDTEKLAYAHSILSPEIQGSSSSIQIPKFVPGGQDTKQRDEKQFGLFLVFKTYTRDKMGSKKVIKQAIRVYVPTNIMFAGDDFVKERSSD